MLYVCISFDYELFMGENRVSEEEVLLKPTEKLSQMLKEQGVSATFFADVCCPKAYRRLGKPSFADAFDAQLQDLTAAGHDVQLHIHPHWEKATHVGSYIEFPREAYRIHHWITEQDGIEPARQIICDGVDYLNGVIRPVDQDYRCLAFRAGGYCLQPEKELADCLYQAGIRIDSSVCRGMAYDGSGMHYDYRTEPRDINIYISRDHGLSNNTRHSVSLSLLEVPVIGYSGFPYRLIASRKNRPMGNADMNGCGMKLAAAQPTVKGGIFHRIKRILTATNMVTFDFYSADAMIYMLNRIEKENKGDDVFISAIAHPKAQTDTHIENMKRVIESLRNNEQIRFVSMRQIADKLRL